MQIKHEISSDEDRINFIRIARTNGVGMVTFFNLLEEAEDFSDIIEFSEEFLKEANPKKPIKIASRAQILKEIENVERFGARMLLITDDDYPELLKHIPDPPPVITVKGDVSLFDRDIIGVVGSRNASFHGLDYAKYIAREISKSGAVVASGLAKGIDGAVHSMALKGGTIAAIAAGIDNVYPYQNRELYSKVFEQGLIITEFPFGSTPKASNFVQRNRIISGLSYGTVVIEATLRSGSLTTARFANEQGREVFAVPGFPSDARSAGCNRLIEQGAIFTSNAEQVVDEISSLRGNFRGEFSKIRKKAIKEENKKSKKREAIAFNYDEEVILSEAAQKIYKKLGSVEISVEVIYEMFASNVQNANIALSELEIEGMINVENGKILKV